MNLPEARATLAAYLTGGRRIARADLEAALALVRSDKASAARLRDATGLADPKRGLCAEFRTRVAEFGELSPAERAEELPELTAHAGQCRACRALYGEQQPVWVVAGGAAQTVVRTLTEKISLFVKATGELLEREFHPFAEEETWVATTAGVSAEAMLGPVGQRRRQWRIPDVEIGYFVCLAVEIQETRWVLRATIEEEAPPVGAARAVRLDITRHPEGGVIFAGRLADWETAAFRLEPGFYLIAVETGSLQAVRWNIPLEIGFESTGENNPRHAHDE